MDAVTAPPERHPLRLAGLAAGGAALVLAGAALILFLWLRTYAPLDARGTGVYAPGAGLAADVEPVTGSGGKTVFIPAYHEGRAFDTAFTLRNTGRFAVTLLGLAPAAGPTWPRAAALFTTDSASAGPVRLHPFERFRLDPDDTATVVVRWRLGCPKQQAETYSDSVVLRYRYLSMFTRTERVALPFAVTIHCVGGPLSP